MVKRKEIDTTLEDLKKLGGLFSEAYLPGLLERIKQITVRLLQDKQQLSKTVRQRNKQIAYMKMDIGKLNDKIIGLEEKLLSYTEQIINNK